MERDIHVNEGFCEVILASKKELQEEESKKEVERY